MATYRQVQTTFWQDGFVLSLTPEEKYFYLYLMTNSKTTQCGVYELPKRVIEMETGYNRETVDKLLDRFVNYDKVKYHEKTQEIIVLNWLRYNSINSPKVKACIVKELKNVKNPAFIEIFYTLCKRYKYSIDTVSIDLGEEEEKEEEKEVDKDITTTTDFEIAFSRVNKIYGAIHGKLDIEPMHLPLLTRLLNEGVSADLIIQTMQEKHAEKVKAGGRVSSFNYYEDAIMERHAGVKTKVTQISTKYQSRREEIKPAAEPLSDEEIAAIGEW